MRDLQNSSCIATMGYEKTDVLDYIGALIDADVQVLVDVRERPISRKKGFSKAKLKETVEAHGIRYFHFHALGDPKPGREAARAGEHDLFVSIFTNHMATEIAQAALEDLAKLVHGQRICLMCFERDHTCCHRSIVARQLSEITGAEVLHLEV